MNKVYGIKIYEMEMSDYITHNVNELVDGDCTSHSLDDMDYLIAKANEYGEDHVYALILDDTGRYKLHYVKNPENIKDLIGGYHNEI